MKLKKIHIQQLSLDQALLEMLCNHENKWVQLSKAINWTRLEKELGKYYADFGRPANDIRLMCSLLIIKQLENLSDVAVVEAWIQNPYYQYFSGAEYFSWEQPCTPSSLTHFRNRIGESGVSEIFRESVLVNGEDALEDELVADTTTQEKNITFPTDTKLHTKIIQHCWKIASAESIKLRQSYTRTMKSLLRAVRFGKGKKQASAKKTATRKIKTIAQYLVRELLRKGTSNPASQEKLALFEEIFQRQKDGKNKIYSIHEPHVKCLSKGKFHKKYEFGNKASFTMTKDTVVIVSAVSFDKNIHDSKTIEPSLDFHYEMTGVRAKKLFYDRGGRGVKKVRDTDICIPESGIGKTNYQKRQAKKNFGRRAAIEPVIGHLKNDYRMMRNYLKGTQGDAINVLMAAAAFNFKRAMRLGFSFVCFFLQLFIGLMTENINENKKQENNFLLPASNLTS